MNENKVIHAQIELPRWRMLISSIFVMLCTGSTYAFSVLIGPLAAAKGWTPADAVLAFAINAAIAPIPMIISGKLVDKGYAKQCILVGGSLFGIGYFLSGLATTIPMLYLSYGIVCGVGQAFAYSGCLGNAVRLFPDRRGLAVGLVTAGNGGAAIIMAPVLSFLIQRNGVLAALRTLGIVFLVVSVVVGLVVKSAQTGYIPKGWTPPAASQSSASINEGLPWNKMIRTPNFYMLLIMFGIGTLSGLMIVSNLSKIAQSMFGLSATVAAVYVSLYSLSNCLGRIAWGAVSDKIGRYYALMAIYVVVGSMLFIMANASTANIFLVAIIGIGLCFGGTMGIMPPIVTENFGAKYYGVNYGVIFIGYAMAAFFGPKVAANVAAANGGDFTKAFYMAMVCGVIGLAVTILYVSTNRKKQESVVEVGA
jgi:MFS transporter, OFA family, oxalate/formate antiporter